MDDATLSQASSEYWGAFHDETEPVAEEFVVIWDDNHITVEPEKWVSDAYDLADCDAREGVREILALNEHGKLSPVFIGGIRPINQDEECPFYYAHAPIMAGRRIAGYVTYTDH